jgi:hypothetical protein
VIATLQVSADSWVLVLGISAVHIRIADPGIRDTLVSIALEFSSSARVLLGTVLGSFVRFVPTVLESVAQISRLDAFSIVALELAVSSAQVAARLVEAVSAICSSVANPALVDTNIGRTLEFIDSACILFLVVSTSAVGFVFSLVTILIPIAFSFSQDASSAVLTREFIRSTNQNPRVSIDSFDVCGSIVAIKLICLIVTVNFTVAFTSRSNTLTIAAGPFVRVAAAITAGVSLTAGTSAVSVIAAVAWAILFIRSVTAVVHSVASDPHIYALTVVAGKLCVVASAVFFIAEILAVVDSVAGCFMGDAVEVHTGEHVIRASAFSFVRMIPAIVESVALQVPGDTLAIRALEFSRRAEAHHLIRVVAAIVDTVASDILRVAETVGALE